MEKQLNRVCVCVRVLSKYGIKKTALWRTIPNRFAAVNLNLNFSSKKNMHKSWEKMSCAVGLLAYHFQIDFKLTHFHENHTLYVLIEKFEIFQLSVNIYWQRQPGGNQKPGKQNQQCSRVYNSWEYKYDILLKKYFINEYQKHWIGNYIIWRVVKIDVYFFFSSIYTNHFLW